MENKVFLLLPIIGKVANDMEQVFLKTKEGLDLEEVTELINAVSKAFNICDHERFMKLFDQKRFNEIKSHVKTLEAKTKPKPSVTSLLGRKFGDFVDFRVLGNNIDSEVEINHVKISSSIINTFANDDNPALCVLMDADALHSKHSVMSITKADGTIINASVIDVDAKAMFNWFVENRAEKRTYDKNYKKHPLTERLGNNGVVISKMTYKPEQAQAILNKAVGAKDDSKNLFFLDKDKNAIVVFWDEGLTPPQYHGYEVSPDVKQNLQKVFQRGGTDLMHKIEAVADY